MDYEIVPLSEEHYDDWLVLFKEYLDFSEIKAAEWQIKNSWEMMLGTYKMQGCYVALYKEKPIGFAGYSFHPCLSNGVYICTLDIVYISEAHRRCGVTSLLLKSVDEACQEKKIPCIRIYTHKTNQPMQSFLDKNAPSTGFLQYQKYVDLSQPTD